jgi:hypothetical protein
MFGGLTIEVSDAIKFGTSNEVVVEVRAANFGNKAKFNPKEPGQPLTLSGSTTRCGNGSVGWCAERFRFQRKKIC